MVPLIQLNAPKPRALRGAIVGASAHAVAFEWLRLTWRTSDVVAVKPSPPHCSSMREVAAVGCRYRWDQPWCQTPVLAHRQEAISPSLASQVRSEGCSMSATGPLVGEDGAMTDLTPQPHTPAPQSNSVPRLQVVDAVVACLLLVGQPVVLCGTLMFLGLMVMGTDACAYQACGDPVWLNRAIWADSVGGGILLLGTAVLTLLRIVRNRAAWFIPVIGYLAQLALGLMSWLIEMQAGPIGH